jgi:hypothetical protein
MEKFFILASFVVVIGALVAAYERPVKSKKKITGRGGDFES